MLKVYINEGKDNVILIIEDNGIGIFINDVGRVFDKGFIGENGRVYGKFIGIGFYLCKKFCEKLGFGILLYFVEGEGTKVNIIFPIGKFTSFK